MVNQNKSNFSNSKKGVFAILSMALLSVLAYSRCSSAGNIYQTLFAEEMAGIVISQASVSLSEGESQDIGVRLNAEPLVNIVIQAAAVGNDLTFNGANQTSLIFSTTNWNVNQTLTIIAVDDINNEAEETITVTVSVSAGDEADYTDSLSETITVTIAASDPTGPVIPDLDNDGEPDVTDLDDDNDRLIEITTLAHLEAVRNDLDGDGIGPSSPFNSNLGCPSPGCNGYELMAAVDLSSIPNWTPIGASGSEFTAIFDGNGNTIQNLTITGSSDYRGLFGATNNAELRNIALETVSVAGQNNVGGLVGENIGRSIINCHVIGTVAGARNVGGLVGYNRVTTSSGAAAISNSYAEVTVTATASNIGGLVGYNRTIGAAAASILNSYATGIVMGSRRVGGLVGHNYSQNGDAIISNSYAIGDVTGMVGATETGGLVGYNQSLASNNDAIISNSYATGAVRGGAAGSKTGGLVGWNQSTTREAVISNSYATGNVTGGGNGSQAGGLVGDNDNADVDNTYATGTVSGTVSGSGIVGGLVGRNTTSSRIRNSYATGNVTGGNASSQVGGLVGNNDNANISRSYATGMVMTGIVGGLVGVNNGSITRNNYFVTSPAVGTGSCIGTCTMQTLTEARDSLDESLNAGLDWDAIVDANGDSVWGQLNMPSVFPCLLRPGTNVCF